MTNDEHFSQVTKCTLHLVDIGKSNAIEILEWFHLRYFIDCKVSISRPFRICHPRQQNIVHIGHLLLLAPITVIICCLLTLLSF